MNLNYLKNEYKKLNEQNDDVRYFMIPKKATSKEVQPNARKSGSNFAPKNFEKEDDKEFKKAKSVERDSGPASTKDYISQYTKGVKTKGKLDKDTTIDREPGASGGRKAVGEYGSFKKFKNDIRQKLGLPLDDPLNKGYKD